MVLLKLFSLLFLSVIAGSVAVAQGGELTMRQAATFILDAPVRDVAMTPDGRFLYAITENDGALLGYEFDRDMGELTPLANFPLELAAPSYRPTALAMAPSGRILYVAHEGMIGRSLLAPVTIMAVDVSTGSLEFQSMISLPIDGTPLTDITVSGGGDTLVVAGVAGDNVAFIPLESLDPSERIAFTQLEFPEKPAAVAISADSQFVYALLSETGTISAYGFAGVDTGFVPLNDSPFEVSGNAYTPADLALPLNSTELLVAHTGHIQRSLLAPVTIHQINPDGGQLTAAGRFGLPSQTGELNAISSDSTGSYITVVDSGTNTLYILRVNRPAVLPLAPVQIVTITLEPYRTFCSGVGPQLCYVANVDGQETLLYGEIEGFTFEWGTAYELRVRVEPVANPPADASSIRYVLEAVLSQEPVRPDFTFEITVPPMIITPNDDGTFTVLGELNFTCAEAMCAEIEALLSGTDNIELVMRFPEAVSDPLQARLKLER